jgi:uncharacterized protein YunC (DUF1805 family)
MKSKKTYIVLTAEQIEQLKPINKQVIKASRELRPGMMLAQLIVFSDGKGVMVCGFIDHARSVQICGIAASQSVRQFENTNWLKVRKDIGIDK